MIRELVISVLYDKALREKEILAIRAKKSLEIAPVDEKLNKYSHALFALYKFESMEEYVSLYKVYEKLYNKRISIKKLYRDKEEKILLEDLESLSNFKKNCAKIYSKHIIGEINLDIGELLFIDKNIINVPNLVREFIDEPISKLVSIDSAVYGKGRSISVFSYNEDDYYKKVASKYNILPIVEKIKLEDRYDINYIYKYDTNYRYKDKKTNSEYNYHFDAREIYKNYSKKIIIAKRENNKLLNNEK